MSEECVTRKVADADCSLAYTQIFNPTAKFALSYHDITFDIAVQVLVYISFRNAKNWKFAFWFGLFHSFKQK